MNDLDNLDGLVASTDAANNEATAASMPIDPNAPPPEPTRQEQAADLVNMFVGMATGYAPEVAPIWSDDAKQSSAAVIAPLLEKYNVSLVNLPPELIAVIVVGPLLWQTSKLIALKIKRDQDQSKKAQPQTGVNLDEKPEGNRSPQMALYPEVI